MRDMPLTVPAAFRVATWDRVVRQGTVAVLVVLLVLQIVMSTVFNTVDRFHAVAAATGLNHIPGVEPVTGFDRLNLAVHAAIVFATFALPVFRRRLARYRAVVLLTVAYGALVVGSTAANLPYLLSPRVFQAVLIPLTILSLGVCLPAMLDLDDYDVLFRGAIAALAVSAIVSLFVVATEQPTLFGQTLTPPIDSRGGRLAASGLFIHRNTIGSFLQFGPPLLVYLIARRSSSAASSESRARTWLYGGALALISVHLLLTFSRSSQVVAAVALLPALFAAVRHRRTAFGLVACLIAAVIVVAAVPEFRRYIALGATLNSRQGIWENVIQQGVQRPLFGHGLWNVDFFLHGDKHSAHSTFLAQFAFFGLAGSALFAMLLMAFGRLVVQNLRSGQDWTRWLMVMVVVGALLQGIVEYIITAPITFANSMFWICLGLATRRPEDDCL